MLPPLSDIVPPRLEPLEYLRKPQVICRFFILVLAIIVIGVVHNDCQIYGECLFNGDISSCGYALFLGSVAVVSGVVFLLFDVWVDNIPNSDTRKSIILADLVTAGCSTFLWFVGFCLLCNRWQSTTDSFLKDRDVSPSGPQAAIAFTFFSFVAWGVLTYLANMSYTAVRIQAPGLGNANTGVANNFSAYTDPSAHTYHGFTHDAEMLDPTRPARLASDPNQFGYGNSGVPSAQPGGGMFTGTLVETYQP